MKDNIIKAVSICGRFASHYTLFIILLQNLILQGFAQPLYVLIILSSPMFVLSLILIARRFFQIKNLQQEKFLQIDQGALYAIFLLQSVYWISLVAIINEHSLNFISIIVFTIAIDIILKPLISKYLFFRNVQLECSIPALLGFIGFIISEFLEKQNKNRFSIKFIPLSQIMCYLYIIINRTSTALANALYKRSILIVASFERYHAFKKDPQRSLRLFDFNHQTENVGELIKPIASSQSAIYKKAQANKNYRKLVAESLNQLVKTETIDQITFNSDLSKHFTEIQNYKTEQIKDYYNKWSKLQTISPSKQFDSIMQEFDNSLIEFNQQYERYYPKPTIDIDSSLKDDIHQENLKLWEQIKEERITDKIKELSKKLKIEEEMIEQMRRRKLWAIAMSQEIQELLHDYKGLSLNEHLFTGKDDATLSKLDELFDNPLYDNESFGSDLSQHYLNFSITNGLLGLPMFIIANYILSEQNIVNSYFGLLENIDFYQSIFQSNWIGVLLVVILSVLQLLQPLLNHQFFMNLNNSETYLITDIFCFTFYLALSILTVELATKLQTTSIVGLLLAIISKIIFHYQISSVKQRQNINSMISAVKDILYAKAKSLNDIDFIDSKLESISKLDVRVANELLTELAVIQKLSHFKSNLTLSTIQIHSLFDKQNHKNTALWGGAYPKFTNEKIILKESDESEEAVQIKSRYVLGKVKVCKTTVEKEIITDKSGSEINDQQSEENQGEIKEESSDSSIEEGNKQNKDMREEKSELAFDHNDYEFVLTNKKF